MLEKIYDTIRGILYYKMPKNAEGKVVIYDRVVQGWYFGDRDVKPSSLSIIVYGSTVPVSDVAFGLQEVEHKITIGVDAGADNSEISERQAQELARVVYEVLKSYRNLWIMDLCPICGKWSMTPRHFIEDHGTLMAPFVTASTTNFNNLWSQNHSASAPTLPDSGLAADAYIRLYEAVRNNDVVANLSTEGKNNILQMQKDLINPLRLLYGIKTTDVKPSDDGRGQQLLRQGQFTLSAKEIIKVVNLGPDDVPIEAV
jgi:hypothetical protein